MKHDVDIPDILGTGQALRPFVADSRNVTDYSCDELFAVTVVLFELALHGSAHNSVMLLFGLLIAELVRAKKSWKLVEISLSTLF